MERISGVDPGLALLLQRTSNEELDYGFVMDCLSSYKNPRVKLCCLLKIGALIRVKRGIYHDAVKPVHLWAGCKVRPVCR